MHSILKILLAVLLPAWVAAAAPAQPDKPNVLLIVADDLGYADVGFQGATEVKTPALDKLARSGLRCSSGYVSHPYCSPTRAGLMAGRYQQRFGHEHNPHYDPSSSTEGLPITEKLLPEHLRGAGYVTGWIGKWHLGAAPEFRPLNRGFMETYGFIGGGHRYQAWNQNIQNEYLVPLERNGTPVDAPEHLTVAFGKEAGAFITRHQAEPWFLYLAFNAPHTPNEPTAERLAQFGSVADPKRRAYLAQISLMDDAIAAALDALEKTGQEKRTLVFFFSDNGGPVGERGNGSVNTPLRAGKGTTYEGGVRVPFLVSWPGRIPAGREFAQPVMSLDVFATALGVAGAKMPADRKYDSVDLLPYLTGAKAGAPHDRLYWRSGAQLGLREGDWKLVRRAGTNELFDLAADQAEAKDLASAQPDVLKRLSSALDAWNGELIAPVFTGAGGKKPGNPAKKNKQP